MTFMPPVSRGRTLAGSDPARLLRRSCRGFGIPRWGRALGRSRRRGAAREPEDHEGEGDGVAVDGSEHATDSRRSGPLPGPDPAPTIPTYPAGQVRVMANLVPGGHSTAWRP